MGGARERKNAIEQKIIKTVVVFSCLSIFLQTHTCLGSCDHVLHGHCGPIRGQPSPVVLNQEQGAKVEIGGQRQQSFSLKFPRSFCRTLLSLHTHTCTHTHKRTNTGTHTHTPPPPILSASPRPSSNSVFINSLLRPLASSFTMVASAHCLA